MLPEPHLSGDATDPDLLPGARSSDEMLRQALHAFYRENEDRALELLQAILRRDRANVRALYLTALCAHLVTQEQALEDACARAIRVAPRHPYAIACEAVRYLFLANYSRAEDLFKQALSRLPDDLDLYLGLGTLYEYSDNKSGSAAAFQRALELDPDNVRARVALGAVYALEGEFEAAMAEYQRAKAVEPEIENPHQRLGRDYYYEGMIREAATEFAIATREEPEEPAAYFYLLDCLRRLERADEALDVYLDIKQRFGDDPELTSGFFEHFNMQAEALSALEELCRQRPDDPETLLRLARAYRDVGRTADAVGASERAARTSFDDPAPLVLLGELYLELAEYGKAVDHCRRAIALDRNAQSAYTTLADALLFLGRQQESIEAIQEMERVRQEAWEQYQARFSGQDRADAERL